MIDSAISWLGPAKDMLAVAWAAAHLLLVPFFDRDEVKRKTGNAWYWYIGHPLAPFDLYRRSSRPLWVARQLFAVAFLIVVLGSMIARFR